MKMYKSSVEILGTMHLGVSIFPLLKSLLESATQTLLTSSVNLSQKFTRSSKLILKKAFIEMGLFPTEVKFHPVGNPPSSKPKGGL